MEPVIKNEIRIDLAYKLIKENWKKFLVIMSVTSVLTYALVCCVPRYYVVNLILAPEYGDQSIGGNGALSAAASMFGVNLGQGGTDAITPDFYPDIVKSTDFLVSIMEADVATEDGDFKGTYGEYILAREKYPWWMQVFAKIINLFKGDTDVYSAAGNYKVNPFKLTKAEFALLQRVASSIDCVVDDKTGVITLSVKAQEPYIAAIMSNKFKDELQEFITLYRTEKKKLELIHTTAMCDTAFVEYLEAQKVYADYVDKHQGLSRKVFQVEEERLSGEMQLAFNIYNTLSQQRLLGEAELQRRTPAFTVLQNATVPVKPAGPKRMIITAALTFLAAILYFAWLVIKSKSKSADVAPVVVDA